MLGILRRDLFYRKFGGRNDCFNGFVVAAPFGPAQFQPAFVLNHVERRSRVRLQTQTRRLKYRRDCRANDVLAMLREAGMTVSKNRRQPVTAVSTKGYVEHVALWQADLRDFDFGEALAMAGELANALFRLVFEDQDFLVFALA